jgi:hypothetical protein
VTEITGREIHRPALEVDRTWNANTPPPEQTGLRAPHPITDGPT